MTESLQQLSLEELVEQFKQLPDHDKYPLPEVIYEKFNIKKPKPTLSLMESLTYQPPLSQPLNKNGKVEIRPPAEGGVREIKEFMTLPVEQTLITDETDDDTKPDSDQTTLNPPIEDNKTEILHGWDHQSVNPSYVSADSVPDVPCPDAECSPEQKSLQNE